MIVPTVEITNTELEQKTKELENINDKLSRALIDAEQRINKAIEKLYCWGEAINPDFQKEMLSILKEEELGNEE